MSVLPGSLLKVSPMAPCLQGSTTEFMSTSEEFKNWAEASNAIATIVALALAGYWTYKRFIDGRINVPKAIVRNLIVLRRCTDQYNWVHVEATVTNQGETIIPLEYGYCRIRACLPPAEIVGRHLESNPEGLFETLSESDGVNSCAEVSWPEVVKREWRYSPGKSAIEPGESECFRCDAFVPCSTKVIYIESWIRKEPRPRFLGLVRKWLVHRWYTIRIPYLVRRNLRSSNGEEVKAGKGGNDEVGWNCVSIVEVDCDKNFYAGEKESMMGDQDKKIDLPREVTHTLPPTREPRPIPPQPAAPPSKK